MSTTPVHGGRHERGAKSFDAPPILLCMILGLKLSWRKATEETEASGSGHIFGLGKIQA